MFHKSLAFAITTVSVCVAFATTPTSRVEEDISEKGSEQKISYDKLADGSVPAAAAINAGLRKELVDSACGANDDADNNNGYEYNANASAIEVNANYVAYQIQYDDYCGGAHPNAGTYHMTFNSKTGAKVDLDKEFPRQDVSGENPNFDDHDKYQRELAETMLAEIKRTNSQVLAESGCFDDGTDADKIDTMVSFWPSITGLGPDKKVITSISPPHAATPCQFDFPVSLSVVEKFLAPNSVLKEWLK